MFLLLYDVDDNDLCFNKNVFNYMYTSWDDILDVSIDTGNNTALVKASIKLFLP